MKGIVQDKVIQTFGEGEYFFAKNIVQLDKEGSIVNEEGNLLHSDIGSNKVILGVIPCKDSAIVFWYDGTNSGIGVLNEDSYQEVADPNNVLSNLSFSYSYPISGKYFINNDGKVVVAFHADNFKPLIVNIGLLSNPVVTDANDDNDILLFPESVVADITTSINTAGGSLLSGTYYITYAYKNTDTVTGYYNISNPISIQDDISEYDGCIAGIITNKSITVTLTGIDTRYDFIRLGYIYKDSVSVKAFEIKDYSITGTIITIVVNGSETSNETTVEELTIPAVQYTKVKDLAVLNDRLYAANLVVRDDIEYQQYANDIVIDYNYTIKSIGDGVKLEQSNRSNGGFIHSEVYCFYIRFWLNDGSVSKWFHIPGRPYVVGDAGTVNTVTYGNKNQWYYMSKFDVAGASSNMGYWENTNETYPTTGNFPTTGDSGNLNKVRHHRFPSHKHIRSLLSGADLTDYGITKMSVLGIDVSNVTNIPTDATHWEIGYAKRDYDNCTQYSVGLANYAHYQGGNDSSLTDKVWSGGVQYNVVEGAKNPTDTDEWIINDGVNNTYKYVRFNTFDTQVNKPGLSNPYIHLEYLLTRDMTTAPNAVGGEESWTFFSGGNPSPNNPFGNNDYDRRRVVVDYTKLAKTTVTNLTGNTFIGIPYYEYLNTDSIGGTYASKQHYNIRNEATLLLVGDTNIVNAVNTNPVGSIAANWINTTFDGGAPVGVMYYSFLSKVYFMSLKSLRTDIYNSFFEQEVCSTGKLNLESVSSVTNLLGGDAFLCEYSFITTAQNAPNNEVDSGVYGGIRAVHKYLGESSLNGNLRYEISSNYYSKYHSKSDFTELNVLFDSPNYLLGIEPNQIQYNRESTSLNDLKQSSINNPDLIFQTKFPYRIIRSQVQNRESRVINWKQWLAQDYYESVRDRGEIISIEGFLPKFIIHHEKGLFITKDRIKLPTNVGEVQIGSGDIFELDPLEIIPTTGGYAGCQNKLSVDVNKLGYCFIDAKQGKVFIFNDSLNEISNTGMRNFFRDNFPMWQTNISTVTRTITRTYNSKTNLTTLPKYEIEETLQGKVWYDVIPPANYLNKYGEDYYYRKGDFSGSSSLTCIKRYQELAVGDNPYYGLGYSIAYDEKWNRLLLSKIRECYFTIAGGEQITRTKYNNQITKTLYTNTATREVTGVNNNVTTVFYLGQYFNYIYDITFEYPHNLLGGTVDIEGGNLAGTYNINVIDIYTIRIENPTALTDTLPYGYITGSATITEYWNGSSWQSTATTWITYGSAASSVSGADTQTNDGGVLNYFVNGDIWQTGTGTYTTYNSSAQSQGVQSLVTPAYSVVSTVTEYFNGTDWVLSPVPTDLVVTKDCSIPYLEGKVNGKYITGDIKFIGKLQVGDVVIDESTNTYKQWNGSALENVTKYDSWTYSYSPKTNMWVSSHSYKPKRLFSTYNKLWSVDNNKIYLHNIGTVTTFAGVKYPAYIDVVFNAGDKVLFSGLSFQTDVYDEAGVNQYNETIDYITVWNNNQCTKRIELLPSPNWRIDGNVRRIYDSWKFNDLRDSNVYNKQFVKSILEDFKLDLSTVTDKRSYNQGRFITSAIIVRLEIISDSKVYIHKVEPIIKKISR